MLLHVFDLMLVFASVLVIVVMCGCWRCDDCVRIVGVVVGVNVYGCFFVSVVVRDCCCGCEYYLCVFAVVVVCCCVCLCVCPWLVLVCVFVVVVGVC